MSLVGVQREVPYGEGVLEQARQIVTAQLTPAPSPLVSAIPPGATLRALYLTERGDAFVDLSAEVRTMHSGGALDELFAVYSIVNAVTTNLPAVTRVQILIDGKEVDTLAGHVDLRHPLQKNMKWMKPDADSRAPAPDAQRRRGAARQARRRSCRDGARAGPSTSSTSRRPGLHFEDTHKLLDVLNKLVDQGNTVVIIEHNLDVIKSADYVIDLGPEGGEGGGRIVAKGTPEDVARSRESFTGRFLADILGAPPRRRPREDDEQLWPASCCGI